MMLIEDFLERVDWKKMIYGGLGILGLFLVLVLIMHFFNRGPEVVLKKTEFEFGEPVSITSYIESFDGESVYAPMIKNSSVLDLDSRTVRFSPVKTDALGDQSVEYEVTDKVTDKTDIYHCNIRIIDSTPPDLTVREELEVDLDSFGHIKPADLVEKVSDQCTPPDRIALAMSFDSKAELGKTVSGTVTATDTQGNISSARVLVKIKGYVFNGSEEKEQAEKERAEKEQAEKDSATLPDHPVIKPNAEASVPAPGPSSAPVQKPDIRYFLFSDGYDMANVESACSAAGDSSGFPYACSPITDSDGLFTGMILTFD